MARLVARGQPALPGTFIVLGMRMPQLLSWNPLDKKPGSWSINAVCMHRRLTRMMSSASEVATVAGNADSLQEHVPMSCHRTPLWPRFTPPPLVRVQDSLNQHWEKNQPLVRGTASQPTLTKQKGNVICATFIRQHALACGFSLSDSTKCGSSTVLLLYISVANAGGNLNRSTNR